MDTIPKHGIVAWGIWSIVYMFTSLFLWLIFTALNSKYKEYKSIYTKSCPKKEFVLPKEHRFEFIKSLLKATMTSLALLFFLPYPMLMVLICAIITALKLRNKFFWLLHIFVLSPFE